MHVTSTFASAKTVNNKTIVEHIGRSFAQLLQEFIILSDVKMQLYHFFIEFAIDIESFRRTM